MNFFTIRMSKNIDGVLEKLLVNNEKEIIISELNQNKDYINDKSVFLLYVKGGATASEWWIKDPDYRGTLFIATLNKEPEYYDKKNFEIEVNIQYRFNKPLTQEMCKFYPDTYNTEVGPKTKGSQTQAIAYLQDEKQVLGILRAALYYNPEAENFYRDFFGEDYLKKIKSAMRRFVEKQMDYESEKSIKKSDNLDNKSLYKGNIPFPHNRIIFGAPGTGKSHQLDSDLRDENGADYFAYHERVTFHPSYSYAQFVGTYKPIKSKLKQEEITYEYVPGPFMRVYVNAKKNPDKKFLLLIEEINRANVSAVFGDVFQLLDRKNDGTSQYPISAIEDQKNYLESCGINEDEIAIPSNMFIWATMNSADQGVQPMDAAFKRRWEFEYLNINNSETKIDDNMKNIQFPDQTMDWNLLRHLINNRLSSNYNINEDKLLGPFFIKKGNLNNDQFINAFKSKVLMYLFEDVCKINPKPLFAGIKDERKIHFSKIIEQFDANGLGIFGFSEAEKEMAEKEIQ